MCSDGMSGVRGESARHHRRYQQGELGSSTSSIATAVVIVTSAGGGEQSNITIAVVTLSKITVGLHEFEVQCLKVKVLKPKVMH